MLPRNEFLQLGWKTLEQLCRPLRLGQCIYDFTDSLRKSGLPGTYRFHSHPFCLGCKQSPGGADRCAADDHRKAQTSRGLRGEVLPCWAGVRELVIPLVIGERLAGAVMIGPFRYTTDPPATATRKDLPVVTPQALDHLTAGISFVVEAWAEALSKPAPADPGSDGKALHLADSLGEETFNPCGRTRFSANISGALAILRREFTEPIDLTGLCRRIGVSRAHFSRTFSHEVGLSFTDYLRHVRLSYAGILLKETDHPAREVAMLCGYTNPVAFQMAFARVFRLPPGAYRRMNQTTRVRLKPPRTSATKKTRSPPSRRNRKP